MSIINGIGIQSGASAIVGGDSLPPSPTFRQVFMTSGGMYICTADGNWTLLEAGTTTGEVTGNGVTDRLTKWINGSGSVIGDSGVADDGTTILSLRPIAVGYGLSAPAQLFAGPRLSVASTISTSPRGILSAQYSSDTAGARVGFQKARGTIGTPTTVVTGDTLGRLMFRGYDGTSYLEMGSIECASTGTIGTNRVPTTLVFSTATDANPSVLTAALTLGANQSATFSGGVTLGGAVSGGGNQINNVIIGTSNPLAGAFTTVTGSTSGTFGAAFTLAQANTTLQVGHATTASLEVSSANNARTYLYVDGAIGGVGTFDALPFFIAAGNNIGISVAVDKSVSFAGVILNPGITSDATHVDSAVCQDTTTHQFYAGSGAAGICLGTSSKRFKRNISDIKEGLNEVLKLRPRNFRYKKDIVDGGAKVQYGLIAEEVEEVIPSIVAKGNNGEINSVDYGTLFSLLTKAVQEVVERYDAQIELLNTRLNTALAR